MKELDEGGRRWLLKTARQHYWRVSAFMDFDDLVQEGLWKWCYVVRKYEHIDHMPHLMALFKTAFNNHLNTITSKNSRHKMEFFEDLLPGASVEEVLSNACLVTIEDNSAVFTERLAMAPPLVRKLLNALLELDGPTPLKGHARCREDGTRETTNERLCRLIGADARYDLYGETISFLRGGF